MKNIYIIVIIICILLIGSFGYYFYMNYTDREIGCKLKNVEQTYLFRSDNETINNINI